MQRDLAYYKSCFDHLSVNKKGGQLAPHKPLLLLSIIDLVDCGIIKSHKIELSEALITAFELNKMRYTRNILHFKPNIGMPFFYMNTEPFWKLVPKVVGNMPYTYAISTLRDSYKYAEIDNELFSILQEPSAAEALRQVLIDAYLLHP